MGGFDTQLSCFKYNLIITLHIVMQVEQRVEQPQLQQQLSARPLATYTHFSM